jgi:hypothetical protein
MRTVNVKLSTMEGEEVRGGGGRPSTSVAWSNLALTGKMLKLQMVTFEIADVSHGRISCNYGVIDQPWCLGLRPPRIVIHGCRDRLSCAIKLHDLSSNNVEQQIIHIYYLIDSTIARWHLIHLRSAAQSASSMKESLPGSSKISKAVWHIHPLS